MWQSVWSCVCVSVSMYLSVCSIILVVYDEFDETSELSLSGFWIGCLLSKLVYLSFRGLAPSPIKKMARRKWRAADSLRLRHHTKCCKTGLHNRNHNRFWGLHKLGYMSPKFTLAQNWWRKTYDYRYHRESHRKECYKRLETHFEDLKGSSSVIL